MTSSTQPLPPGWYALRHKPSGRYLDSSDIRLAEKHGVDPIPSRHAPWPHYSAGNFLCDLSWPLSLPRFVDIEAVPLVITIKGEAPAVGPLDAARALVAAVEGLGVLSTSFAVRGARLGWEVKVEAT